MHIDELKNVKIWFSGHNYIGQLYLRIIGAGWDVPYVVLLGLILGSLFW
jgi:hypothetical protein